MLGPLYAHREAYIILFESQDATSVGENHLSRGFLQEMTTSSSSLVPPCIAPPLHRLWCHESRIWRRESRRQRLHARYV